MNWLKQQSRQENLIYLVMWGMLFAAPILSMYVRTLNNSTFAFSWDDVFFIWQKFAIFLVLFLVHNFLLAPLLIYRHKRLLYFSLTAAIIAVFAIYQCTTKPAPPHRGPRPEMELMRPHAPRTAHHDAPRTMPHAPRTAHHAPPLFVGEHDIVAVVILILMFGMNMGIKGFFRSREDHQRLARLEKENLEQQLEYLKYQINPHFFMNTLNNIHALVDIDPEKAKDTIVELSKMMRFILYEGDKHGVPLSREFDFIRNYLTLMRLRYTDKVAINVELPAEVPDKTIPPLMLISFIENAFKHGISYQHNSFIDIKIAVSHEQLHFTCRNSKAERPNQEKGGVGLKNVRKRLNLLFDNHYTLDIHDAADVYSVALAIPI